MTTVRHLLTIARTLSGGHGNPQAFQLAALRRLVAHTWRHNPAIAAWWRQAGLSPAPIDTLDDLALYPITSKSQYQQLSTAELTSINYRSASLGRHVTSGSTGVPLAIYRTSLEDLVMRSFRLAAHRGYGLGWFDRRAAMRTGLSAGMGGRKEESRPSWMRLGLLRRDCVSHVELDIPSVVARLREIRPHALGGHADATWRISLEAPQAELRALNLKFATMGVQTVTPDMQRRVADAFGCPVYVTYGATEFNFLAYQCKQTGLLHLSEEGNYVEVLRDGRPAEDGEEGEVVATNLHAYAIPYIRYALDDWAVMGPSRCPCGLPVRTLRAIQGRVAEFFHFSDGRRIHPFQLINPLLAFIGWLREYRMVQTSRDAIDVWYTVLPGAPSQTEASAAIEGAVGEAAGPAVRVRAVPLETMPLSHRGKNRMFEALPPPG